MPDAAMILAIAAGLAGVIVLARTLVPGEWLGGLVGAGAAATTPAVLDATGGGEGGVVAAATVWAAVLVVHARRAPSAFRVVLAVLGLAGAAAAIAHQWPDRPGELLVGNGAPLLLAGLVGLGLGAVTGLSGAGLVLAIAAATVAASASAATVMLIAAGLAPLAGAVTRMLARDPTPGARLAISAAVSAPVLLVTVLLGGA